MMGWGRTQRTNITTATSHVLGEIRTNFQYNVVRGGASSSSSSRSSIIVGGGEGGIIACKPTLTSQLRLKPSFKFYN